MHEALDKSEKYFIIIVGHLKIIGQYIDLSVKPFAKAGKYISLSVATLTKAGQ